MFHVQYEIIDLRVLQVEQLSKNAGLFILTDLRDKRFVILAVVSVLVALHKNCITATL